MDTIKGFARRTTQSLREKVGHTNSTMQDDALCSVCKKVQHFHRSSEVICMKLVKIAELMEELGNAVRDVGDEYLKLPDLQPESSQLATDVFDVGNKLILTAQEHQKGLKEQGFDLLSPFIKGMSKLKTVEETRRKNQLEYDFFYQKVLDLRHNPPKDLTRIIRNEEIMETWRVRLWESTEKNKAVCSQLYTEGQRALDLSVLSLTQVVGSYLNIAGDGFKKQFVNARLPVYSNAPILPPAPLPPNPMPPYQPPAMPGGYAPIPYGQISQQQQQQQPQQQGWQQDQFSQAQQRHGWQGGQPLAWQQQQQPQQQPQQASAFTGWQRPVEQQQQQQEQQQQPQGLNLPKQTLPPTFEPHSQPNNHSF